MRIKIIGESDCARATRGLLRQAGFAVTEFLPMDAVIEGPIAGYVIAIEEVSFGRPPESGAASIHFDSVDCPLEAAILKHITHLSKLPVVLDRPGGAVHSDREIALAVPQDPEQQHSVEFGVLRGLLELNGRIKSSAPAPPRPSASLFQRAKNWLDRFFSALPTQ